MYSALHPVDLSPAPDLHRPGDLATSLKRHQAASGVCRPHERSSPVRLGARQQPTKQRAWVAANLARLGTLFNTPPNPRPLTPPLGRKGSNIDRSLTPCHSLRSYRPLALYAPRFARNSKEPLPSLARSFHRAASLYCSTLTVSQSSRRLIRRLPDCPAWTACQSGCTAALYLPPASLGLKD